MVWWLREERDLRWTAWAWSLLGITALVMVVVSVSLGNYLQGLTWLGLFVATLLGLKSVVGLWKIRDRHERVVEDHKEARSQLVDDATVGWGGFDHSDDPVFRAAETEERARLAHRLWASWSMEIADQEDISPERRMRWEGLWVPYEDLDKDEKQTDRDLVERFSKEPPDYPNFYGN